MDRRRFLGSILAALAATSLPLRRAQPATVPTRGAGTPVSGIFVRIGANTGGLDRGLSAAEKRIVAFGRKE